MSIDIKRAVISVAILVIIYFAADLFIGSPAAYDASVKSTQFLAAVIAAGCYWIGSNKK